jgi:hypothetical protein
VRKELKVLRRIEKVLVGIGGKVVSSEVYESMGIRKAVLARGRVFEI